MLCALILLVSSPVLAGPKYIFKVATLAPEGSIWTERFHEFADEVRKESGGEVGFKIYPGGVMGDDRAMYRKMRVGQLQGGGFTMTGIGKIVPDFRIMGMPFLFKSYEEADYVREQLTGSFEKSFQNKKLELIAFTEVGFVYTMSTQPIGSLADLKESKAWVPSRDPVSSAYLETIGLTPIQLSIPDVLTSLQTGMVNTVFNSLYGSLVLQWFTKARYITDIPFGYAYGAFLLDAKAFARLPAKHAQLVKNSAGKHFSQMLQDTRKSNKEALQVLQDNGVVLVKITPEERQKLQGLRDEAVQRIKNKSFSAEIFAATMKHLQEFRSK